jgi:hypothetical protein
MYVIASPSGSVDAAQEMFMLCLLNALDGAVMLGGALGAVFHITS